MNNPAPRLPLEWSTDSSPLSLRTLWAGRRNGVTLAYVSAWDKDIARGGVKPWLVEALAQDSPANTFTILVTDSTASLAQGIARAEEIVADTFTRLGLTAEDIGTPEDDATPTGIIAVSTPTDSTPAPAPGLTEAELDAERQAWIDRLRVADEVIERHGIEVAPYPLWALPSWDGVDPLPPQVVIDHPWATPERRIMLADLLEQDPPPDPFDTDPTD